MTQRRRMPRPVRTRTRGSRHRAHDRRMPGCLAPDATIEPDPGPPPEAVFDRLTGPYVRRAALAMPGGCEYDEET